MFIMDAAELSAIDAQVSRTEELHGLRCPMPILRTKKALAQMSAGQILKVITTDPAAVDDLAVFTQQTGHRLLAQALLNDEASNPQIVAHWIAHKE